MGPPIIILQVLDGVNARTAVYIIRLCQHKTLIGVGYCSMAIGHGGKLGRSWIDRSNQ
jgi:hypothetical protein